MSNSPSRSTSNSVVPIAYDRIMRGGAGCIPGLVYHVISRFVAGTFLINSDRDREHYLKRLGDSLANSDWRCFGYAVMSNHIHLALVAGAMPLAGWMRPAHTSFARWINRRDGKRIGPVFVKGPNVRPTWDVGRLINYIHANPVRAGVAQVPHHSTWTSHRAYLGAARPRWLDIDTGMALANLRDVDAFIASSGRFVTGDELHVSANVGRPRRLANCLGRLIRSSHPTALLRRGARIVAAIMRVVRVTEEGPRASRDRSQMTLIDAIPAASQDQPHGAQLTIAEHRSPIPIFAAEPHPRGGDPPPCA